MARFGLVETISRKLWPIPLAGLAFGVALSVTTVALDRRHPSLLSTSVVGTAADAQTILSTIASSVIPLTTTVLTVTLVAVQLAMGQFSPRIVRALLDDRRDQLAIGVFAATFSFAMLSLRAIDTEPGAPVPAVTVSTAFLLMIASAVALFLFVNRAGHRLRVAGLVDLVGDQLRTELDRRYPTAEPDGIDRSLITADRSGNVVGIDVKRLVDAARGADCALELVPMMGDFVVKGSALFRVAGDATRLDHNELRRLVMLGDERTHRDDPAYGFRKLVDVAQRSLGTSQNDPTTAVQVINRLHDCLRQIAPRPFPSGQHADEAGRLRLVVRMIDWDGYIRLAFDEIRLAAGPYPQATRRLRAALDDLKDVAPPARQAALDRQLHLLEHAVQRGLGDQEDIRAALVPDQQGIGSGLDVSIDGVRSATGFPQSPRRTRAGRGYRTGRS